MNPTTQERTGAENLENFVERGLAARMFFENGRQGTKADSNPQLRSHRVVAGVVGARRFGREKFGDQGGGFDGPLWTMIAAEESGWIAAGRTSPKILGIEFVETVRRVLSSAEAKDEAIEVLTTDNSSE